MKRLQRAALPSALAHSTDIGHERARAIRHFEEDGHRDGFTFRLYAHKEVRAKLAGMSGGKCAYCESYYDATAPQDVEHYRPKGRIDTPQGKRKPGYWWLASSWENLLPACIRCNREEEHELYDGSTLKSGKGDRFPIDNEQARGTVRDSEGQEMPLLLNPCVEEPADFLEFIEDDENSIARPLATDQTTLAFRRARVSIDVYGLNRVGLVRHRSRALKRVKQSLALVKYFVRKMDGASPAELDHLEQLFIEEVELIRAHASGQDGFAAVAGPMARQAFAELGLQL